MNISLKTIAKLVNGKCIGCGNLEITSVTTDTRDVKEKSLFVALKGESFDGHDFAIDAIKKGAACVLSQRPAESFSEKIPIIQVESTYKALLDFAKGYRDMLSPVVVGVTGSVGKTTTKDMIAAVLSQGMQTAKTQGNLNNHIGVPKTIFSLKESDRAAVVEMGMNHAGEISVLTQVARPDVAVITNIGISHLEFLKTRENILKAKLEILEGMEEDAPVIINADNDILGAITELGKRRIVRCSCEGTNADICAKNIFEGTEGSRFEIWVNGKPHINAYLPAIGRHNVGNALLAAAVGIEAGLSPEQIAAGLAAYVPSGMRQKVTKLCDMTFIEDCYNASPTSMSASLSVLRSLSEGRAVAVLGDMLELGDITKSAHLEIGNEAAEKCDFLVCCGKHSALMAKAATEKGIKTAFFETREETVDFLLKELKKGDCVLFKASLSMQFEKIISALYARLEEC
ncbi:MAG: UDP-N-acetylmuramoyl-tripeptide--D-alanyl-D-alanine ligase [Oscillospiraceae bacterium]|nr:UDP-N-acetylmuramoyl-tripeptide--D-alanyl-D-alanine ligase [Oscillospiraceae bacterium]